MRTSTPSAIRSVACNAALVVALLCAQNGSAQWQPIGPATAGVRGIVQHNDALFATFQNQWVYTSTDQGANWTATGAGITELSLWAIASVEGSLFAGTQFGATFRSTDNGGSWTNVGLNSVRGFAQHNDSLFVCQWYDATVHYSVNNGDNWNPAAPIAGIGGLWPLTSWHDRLFVGRQGGGVYATDDNGATWMPMNNGLTDLLAYSFTTMANALYVGTGAGGVFRSTDDGATWTSASNGMGAQTVYAMHSVGSVLVAGTETGVYVSNDEGANWFAVNGGLTNLQILCFASDADKLYAGTLNNGMFRMDLDELFTGIGELGAAQLPQLAVAPNPATDIAHISITLPVAAMVQILLYDATGREVANLATGSWPAGAQRIPVAIAALPDGQYQVILRAGDHTVTAALGVLR